LEEDPAIAGSVVRIYTQAASVGEELVMAASIEELSQWCLVRKRSGSGGGEDRWCFPSLAAHPLVSK
jgi:hypothetical protein